MLFILSLAACGNDDASTSPVSTAKNLFSSWAEDGSTFVLDLTQGTFGTAPMSFIVTAGGYCDCSITIGGTQSHGNAVMYNCSYRAGTGAGSDPGCSSLNGSYMYDKDDTRLTICGGGCSTFH